MLRKLKIFAVLQLVILNVINSKNIDSKFAIRFHGQNNSYFGYTVALHNTGSETVVLVGAPKATDPTQNSVLNPGSLLKCSIENQVCDHVVLEKTGNDHLTPGPTDITDLKDDMLLGWSMDVQQTEPMNVVVCGPNWRNKILNSYFVHGACYVIDKQLTYESVKKITPLIDLKYSSVIPFYKFYYSYGQAGFSVLFDKYADRLLLGSPGFADGTGTVIPITPGIDALVLDKPPGELSNKDSVYLGYSVTSGQFRPSGESYLAAGAPRDGDLKGRVYILQPWLQKNRARMNVTEYREGEQFGEYFGYAILGEDVNGDRVTDLVVGSPFYNTFKGVGDVGRIYTYLGNVRGLQSGCKTSGSGIKGARFGSSLSSLGDLNQDGYNDIAVGAPYENEGVVYIYHGSSEGLLCEYSQKITASDVGVKGPGFGMSLSRGLDIDDNHYPDMIIGSYGSDSAVLLRSRPVVQMEVIMSASLDRVDLKSPNCVPRVDSNADPCFKLKMCLIYKGNHGPSKTMVFLNTSVDEEAQSVLKFPRGFFRSPLNKTNPVFKTNRQLELDANIATCFETDVFILKESTVYMDPLDIVAKYGLVKTEGQRFCKTCPVLATKEVNFASFKVPFSVSCGSDNICECDLKIKVTVPELLANNELIIGLDTKVSLDIEVSNSKEAAYAPTVEVIIPYQLKIINPGPCSESQINQIGEDYKLLCVLRNPLKDGEIENFEVKLDVSKIRRNEIQIIKAKVTTVSQELTPENNAVDIALPFKSKTTINLIGIPNPATTVYDEETATRVPFQHKYEIISSDTPVIGVRLSIAVPGFSENEMDIVNVTQLEASTGADCFMDWGTADEEDWEIESALTMESKNTDTREFHLNCPNTKCKFINCYTGPISKDNSIKISVSGFVDLNLLAKTTDNPNLDMVYFTTEGKVYLQEGDVFQANYIVQANVKTTMTKEGYPEVKPVSLWIIITSVLGGVIILICIVIILLKIGFFKREKQEEMKNLKKNDKLLNDAGEANR